MWGLIAAGWLALGGRIERPVDAAAIDPARRIAVLPFSYRGSEESAGLGEDLVHLLSQTLDGGELRTVVPQAVFRIVDDEGGGAADPEHGNAVAERLSAGRYVLGDVVEAGGRLRISARLYDTGSGVEDVATATVEGESDDLFGLVDDLTAEILVGALGVPADRLIRVAAQTTDSLAALRAYLEGKREFRQANAGRAVRAYQRAVDIDSTFALAWFEMSWAGEWGVLPLDQVAEVAEKAAQRSERLPWRERQLLEARRLYTKGEADSLERLCRTVLARYPEDVLAWHVLGRVLKNYNPLRGRPLIEAREPLERALWYEPDSREILFQLAWVKAQEGYWLEADSLLHRRYPEGIPFFWRAAPAYASGDVAAQEQVLAEADTRCCSVGFWLAARFVAIMGKSPRGTRDLALMLAEQAEDSTLRVTGRLLTFDAELSLGRLSAAEAELDKLAALKPEIGIEREAYGSLPRFLPMPRARLEAIRDSLVIWDAAALEPRVLSSDPYLATWFYDYDGVHPHLRLYLLGRLSTRLDDHEAALGYAAELESMETPEYAGTLAFDLAQSIRAHVLRNQGRPTEALFALERAKHVVQKEIFNPFFRKPQDRFLRGELLAELGRPEEALPWYASIGGYYTDLPLIAPSHLRRAEIYERLGDAENAAYHYNTFIELWRDADPELRPMVEAAQRALERLAAESGTD
jgi:tetratricopeptide (TPR) repeat protein